MTASAIERLRELHAEYWKAAGPFKMPPNNPPASMALFDLTHHYVAVSAIALPALLECASALAKHRHHFPHLGEADFDARAALDALAATEVG